jgi:hypothetical protein
MKKKNKIIILLTGFIYLILALNILFIVSFDYQKHANRFTFLPLFKHKELKIDYTYPQPLNTPKKVKGIYLTGYSFTSKNGRARLIKLIESTELNTMVIDIKDPNNKLMFYPEDELLKPLEVSSAAVDNETTKQILTDLQNRNIYTIARITTFQDNNATIAFPDLTLKNGEGKTWYNWQGIAWLDMTNPNAWELPIAQAKEAAMLGFDEIQFDYIRFPSDGNIKTIVYHTPPENNKRYTTLKLFFEHMEEELKDLPIPLSIDLFGLTYQRHKNPDYDLYIGQRLVDAAEHFDYISPMVYPSHYPNGFLGFANPADHPFEIVDKALMEGNLILNTVTSTTALTRPWLQDFDIGAVYDGPMIKAQIEACDKNNCSGWILWNPRNVYTDEALEKI